MGLLTWSTANITPTSLTQVWSEVREIIDVSGARSYSSRRQERQKVQRIRQRKLDEYLKQEPEKLKKVVHLICRIKGEKIYDKKKITENKITVSIDDIDMLEDVMKTKMEVSNVI